MPQATQNEKTVYGLTYAQFMREVDKELLRRAGVTHRDLPDFCTRDAFENGASAHDTAIDILDYSGFDVDGFDALFGEDF